jgi:medium-chain acyl-[acyl-carrier-protein] hydrolase
MSKTSSWVKCLLPNPQAKLRLFCFPYAGGWSQTYRPWAKQLSREIELYSIELPGRGARLIEKPIVQFSQLLQETALGIAPYLDRPFAFFGHSMGALLSFELTQLLCFRGCPAPEIIFVSGHRAPHVKSEHPPIYNLPELEFIEEIRRMEGTPEAVLANAELRELIFPALRADFEAIYNYQHKPSKPLDLPITVFGGLEDHGVNLYALEDWRRYTNKKFRLQMFQGNHFFLHEAQPLILQVIQQQLGELISNNRRFSVLDSFCS